VTTRPDILALADEIHTAHLTADPFGASGLGLPGYDAELPDVSAEADRTRRAADLDYLQRADAVDTDGLSAADAVTLACIRAAAQTGIAEVDAASITYTVSGVFGQGPAELISLASRTKLVDEAAGQNWLTRVTGFPDYLDACLARLREGAAAGRTPVNALVVTAVTQLDELLADSGPTPFLQPVSGDTAAQPWRIDLAARVDAQVRDRLRPALAHYRAVLADELLPIARPDEQAGLVAMAGGGESYAHAVRVHTTLPVTPERIHQQGLADVADDHERMLEIGARVFGAADVPAVIAALRNVGAEPDVAAAMDQARGAVRRAEAAAGAWFDPPAPPPCAVEPMSALLARAGMAPHYSPPSEDGSRVGTYWFNADRPGLGTGPELESVTYHETVPGHHTQLVRMLTLDGVPDLQRQTVVTAHTEGWGLYAEVLAEEMGLYSDDVAVLGMLATDVFRAGRLVVDTGIHALGWSRQQAVDWFVANVPLPADALAAEIDRYIAMPGQALAYKTGQREILRLRASARAELGDRFDIRGFHSAVLGYGSIPLPALGRAVDAWVAQTAG